MYGLPLFYDVNRPVKISTNANTNGNTPVTITATNGNPQYADTAIITTDPTTPTANAAAAPFPSALNSIGPTLTDAWL